MKDDLLAQVQKTPLDKLGKLMEIISDKIYAHRQANKGFVPLAIFPYCVGIGGIYPCVEMVIEVFDDDGKFLGYALKKRSEKEQEWQGKFQIVGVAGRITDGPKEIFTRLNAEIFKKGKERVQIENTSTLIGVEIHDEPERQATCWTLVYCMIILEKDLVRLDGEWMLVDDHLDDPQIVDHHQKTLAWAKVTNFNSKKRVSLVDLRQ